MRLHGVVFAAAAQAGPAAAVAAAEVNAKAAAAKAVEADPDPEEVPPTQVDATATWSDPCPASVPSCSRGPLIGSVAVRTAGRARKSLEGVDPRTPS